MIRLFRKIRQQLLSEDRYSMYFLYASGEVLLVVLGILIALQIDNWNEDRKLRSLTHSYLENIKDDLIADSTYLEDLQEGGNYWGTRMEANYSYYHQEQWTIHQIVDSCLNTGFQFFSYIPIDHTFQDMLTSGKSSLLSEELRMRLSRLQQDQELLVIITENIVNDMKINVHEVEKYWILEESHYFRDFIAPFRQSAGRRSSSYLEPGENQLREGLKYHHNIFTWSYKIIGYIQSMGQDIQEQSSEIIRIIDRELGGISSREKRR